MVCDSSAAEHRVELLPGFVAGAEAVHGVDGQFLRAVHSGGVSELGRGLYVRGGVSVAQVLDVKIAAVADGLHNPAVTVLDPVGCCQPQLAIVAAGDDQLIDTGLISISEAHLRIGV